MIKYIFNNKCEGKCIEIVNNYNFTKCYYFNGKNVGIYIQYFKNGKIDKLIKH
jgi:hypothetical protein